MESGSHKYFSLKGRFLEILGMTLEGFRGFIGIRNPGLEKVEIVNLNMGLPNLSTQFDGYRLVQISDFHLGTLMQKSHLDKVVEIVNHLSPDTVAITGDFVSFSAEKFSQDLVESLNKLNPKDCTVAILGNHDHWTNPTTIRQVLKQSNIIDLSNDVFTIYRGGEMLHFAGVDDILAKQDQLEKVLEEIPDQGAAILLAHEPDFADISAASNRFDLQLSGHTHGGQIMIPYGEKLFLPPEGQKYPKGLYRVNGMLQYTNRGLGTSWLQLRYRCPPEITLFELRKTTNPN